MTVKKMYMISAAIALPLILLGVCEPAHAADRYLDFDSATNGDGSSGSPWNTPSAAGTLVAGDRYFTQGTYRGTWTINANGSSGAPIEIHPWGDGYEITGADSIAHSGFSVYDGSTERTSALSGETFYCIYGDGPRLTEVGSAGAVDAPGEWYYDGSTYLYVYDPDSYTTLEYDKRNIVVNLGDHDYIHFYGGTFEKSTNRIFSGGSCQGVVIDSSLVQQARLVAGIGSGTGVFISSPSDLEIGNTTFGAEDDSLRRYANGVDFMNQNNGTTDNIYIHDCYTYYAGLPTTDGNAFYCPSFRIIKYGGFIHFDNVYIEGPSSHGIVFNEQTMAGGDSILVENCIAKLCGQSGFNVFKVRVPSADTTGTGPYIRFDNCEASYCDWYAGTAGAASSASCGFHVNDQQQAGTTTPFVNTIMENCYAHHCQAPNSPNDADSGGFAIDYNANRAIIRWCRSEYNWGPGIYIFNADDCQVYGNVIIGNDIGINLSALNNGTETCDNNVLYNNIFYKNDNGTGFGPGEDYENEIGIWQYATNNVIRNNIIVPHEDNVAVRITGGSRSNNTFDYNLVWADDPREDSLFYDQDNSGQSSWAEWQAGGMDANGINDDPEFVDPPDSLYADSSDAPQVDTGSSSYNPGHDINGNTIVDEPDIGAYEIQDAGGGAPAGGAYADTISIADGGDDFDVQEATTTWESYKTYNTLEYLLIGEAGTGTSDCNGAFRFQLPIPQGATVDSAFFTGTIIQPYTADFVFQLRGLDVDNAPQQTDYATWLAAQSEDSLTTATVAWEFSDVDSLERVKSPDIKTIVQEWVDRESYEQDNYVMLYINENGSTNYDFMKISDYADIANDPASLIVYYTVAEPDTIGDVTLAAHQTHPDTVKVSIDHADPSWSSISWYRGESLLSEDTSVSEADSVYKDTSFADNTAYEGYYAVIDSTGATSEETNTANLTTSDGNFYVDATLGSDSNSGIFGEPWQTIPKVEAQTFASGDSLLFKRGETWSDYYMIFAGAGTPSNPVYIGAYGSGDKPKFNLGVAGNMSFDGDYTYAENLYIYSAPSGSGVICDQAGAQVYLKDCDFREFYTGINLSGGTSTIDGCTLTDTGQYCIHAYGGCDTLTIINTVIDSSDASSGTTVYLTQLDEVTINSLTISNTLSAGTDFYIRETDSATVTDLTIINSAADKAILTYGSDVTYENPFIQGSGVLVSDNTTGGVGTQTFNGGYFNSSTKIVSLNKEYVTSGDDLIFNRCHLVGDVDSTAIAARNYEVRLNSCILDSLGSGDKWLLAIDRAKLFLNDCTIIGDGNTQTGVDIRLVGSTIQNTIFTGFDTAVDFADSAVAVGCTIDYNLFYDNTTNYGGYALTPAHDQSGDPLFTGAPDYSLSSNLSPAFNNGTDTGVILDYLGNTKPYNSGLWDIGAYELDSEPPPELGPTPTLVAEQTAYGEITWHMSPAYTSHDSLDIFVNGLLDSFYAPPAEGDTTAAMTGFTAGLSYAVQALRDSSDVRDSTNVVTVELEADVGILPKPTASLVDTTSVRITFVIPATADKTVLYVDDVPEDSTTSTGPQYFDVTGLTIDTEYEFKGLMNNTFSTAWSESLLQSTSDTPSPAGPVESAIIRGIKNIRIQLDEMERLMHGR